MDTSTVNPQIFTKEYKKKINNVIIFISMAVRIPNLTNLLNKNLGLEKFWGLTYRKCETRLFY
jgi:hypothetical protein